MDAGLDRRGRTRPCVRLRLASKTLGPPASSAAGKAPRRGVASLIATLPPAAPTLVRPFRDHPATRAALEAFAAETPGVVEVSGPTGVTSTLLTAAAALAHPGPVLLVTAFEDQAHAATADLLNLARGSTGEPGGEGDTHLVVAPFDELGPRDLLGARAEGPVARRLVLAATLDHRRSEAVGENDGRWVVVASAAALLQAVPPAEAVAGAVERLHPGDAFSRERLVEHLLATGHREAEEGESGPGLFHLQGDGSTLRFRPLAAVATDADGRTSTAGRASIDVGFEGDAIGSIRFVDPPTPAWERPLAALTLATPDAARVLQREADRSLLDLFPDAGPGSASLGVVIDDGEAVALELDRLSRRAGGGTGVLTPAELGERLAARPRLVVNGAGRGVIPGGGDVGEAIELDAAPPPAFARDAAAAREDLAARAADHPVVVATDRPEEGALRERLGEAGAAKVLRGVLSHGFHLRGENALEAVPAHELLRRAAPPEAAVEDPRRPEPPSTDSLASVLIDLHDGDPVVHADHGVALYRGMESIAVGIGSRRKEIDHLTLAFAEPDTLRVPAEQAARVFPFHAADDAPSPDPLNGKAWPRKVAAAEAAAAAFVRATRAAAAEAKDAPGRAHPVEPDRAAAFAEAFPFEPTADQAEAFEAVAADLAADAPMDRLVCGDVGFGKTEVAARAIFQVVRPRPRKTSRGGQKGAQAALLAPTTVLAEQHGRSLTERLGPFGVSVATLSRLRSAGEAEEILGRLADGSLDLVIGTTALLSGGDGGGGGGGGGGGLAFADLGLIVVDEEHRFGAADKEALGRLGTSGGVDRLSLTATPIPRTLHTALAGLREVSTLRTAPPGRKPVVTEVLEAGPERRRSALRRELFRGGQAFVLHNRVETLGEATEEVRALLGGVLRPDGQAPVVASAHGQLDDASLEDTLLRFSEGEIDVLVCTTIVENGLDVARAGTIVIQDAERFGLAALHQLRGRVGRAGQRGFCLLEVPPDAHLSEGAQKRLAAMEDSEGLGGGFAVAEADLAVRGAGDLLGDEQSGHVAAVGHGLYSRMIERAAREQAGDLRPAPERCGFFLPGTGSLSEDWIPPALARLNACRWLTHVDSEDQLGEAVARLEETWGPPPPEARRFVAAVRLRLAMADARVTHAAKGKEAVTLTLVLPPDPERHAAHREELIAGLNETLDKERFRAGVEADELLYHPPPGVGDEGLVEHLTELLRR